MEGADTAMEALDLVIACACCFWKVHRTSRPPHFSQISRTELEDHKIWESRVKAFAQVSWPAPLRKKWLRTGYMWNMGPSIWVSCLGPMRHRLPNIRSCQKTSFALFAHRQSRFANWSTILDLLRTQKPIEMKFKFSLLHDWKNSQSPWETEKRLLVAEQVLAKLWTVRFFQLIGDCQMFSWKSSHVSHVPHVTVLAMWMLLVLPLDQLPVLDVWRGAIWCLRCGLCKHWQVPISARLVQFHALKGSESVSSKSPLWFPQRSLCGNLSLQERDQRELWHWLWRTWFIRPSARNCVVLKFCAGSVGSVLSSAIDVGNIGVVCGMMMYDV